MSHLMAVVLAAGEGKRMKSNKSKVIHEVCGKPLVRWVYDAVKNAGIEDCVLVVGHKAEQVKECMGEDVSYALQDEQLGTGHAVMQAEKFLKDKDGFVFVLCGDTPLVTSDTISKAIEYHKEKGFSATVVTAELDNPTGYGRIVRSPEGDVMKIVEHKDTDSEQKNIREINSGMYCFNIKDLLSALSKLTNNNAQGEYYLTDTIEILISEGKKVGGFVIDDSSEILGINDRIQLAQAGEVLRDRIISYHMKEGVTFIDPKSAYIDEGVKIGKDTVIYPGTIIEGRTEIGRDCTIGPNTKIVETIVGNHVEIINSVVLESSVDDNTHVGPFAYIRPNSKIGKKVKIGDFVEIKKSKIGDKTKISHLTYVGDAEVGENVNLGCGVVFVNYDGKKKNKIVVEDNCFVGCNTNLISPVKVREGSYIAAGSTITDDVPSKSLAIARERQTIKEGWVSKKNMERK